MAKPKLDGRIRYEKDWCGEGEHMIFENKWTNEKVWSLEAAFPFVSYDANGNMTLGKGDLLNYGVLNKIKEWKRLGVDFYFC